MDYTYKAFTTLAASGNTASQALPALFNDLSLFFGSAVTFGGGTLKGQVSPDGGTTWLDVPSLTMTSATASTKKADYTVIGNLFRFNLAGATGPSIAAAIRAQEVAEGEVLRSAFTVDVTGATFVLPRAIETFGWAAYGTWGSGTLTLQASPDGGTTWFAVDSTAANAMKHVTSNKDSLFRFVLSGSTSPSLTALVYWR